MKQISTWVVGTLLSLSLSTAASAKVGYVEARDGDFSDDSLAPTEIALGAGKSLIIGSSPCLSPPPGPLPSFCSAFDRDFWTVSISSGFELRSIEVVHQAGPPGNGGSFFAVAAGTGIPSLDTDHFLLGATLVGGDFGVPKGGNVIEWWHPDDSPLFYGGSGVYGPLGAGKYTFWYQEAGLKAGQSTNYSFRFGIAPVPEPATWGLMAAGLGLVVLRAARRSRRSQG